MDRLPRIVSSLRARIPTVALLLTVPATLCAVPESPQTEETASADPPYLPESVFSGLGEMLETARNEAGKLREFELLEAEAEARLDQARGRRLPDADLFLRTGPREEIRSGEAEDNSFWAVNGGLRLSQPLFHWGAIQAEIDQARIGLGESALASLQNELKLVHQLRSRYLRLVLNKVREALETTRRDILRERADATKIEVAADNAPDIDLRDARLDVEAAEIAIDRIRKSQARLRERLRTRYGWSGPIKPPDRIPPLDPEPVLEWLQTEEAALGNGRTFDFVPVRQHLAAMRRHEAREVVINASNRPKVDLFASGIQGVTNTAEDNNVNTFALTVGVSVRWNLFDGFRTQNQKLEARLKKNRMERELDRRIAELRGKQREMIETLRMRCKDMELLERRLSVAEARFRRSEIAFEDNRITEIDLREARLDLEELRVQVQQTRMDLLSGISDYHTFTHLVAAE